MRIRGIRTVPGCLTLLLILSGTGCSPHARLNPLPNVRPVIELTRAPYSVSERFDYYYRMNWVGFDPDGRVDYYRYAIDPPSVTPLQLKPDTAWVNTISSEQLIRFDATVPDSTRLGVSGSSDFHTFVVKAIDNGGNGGPLQSAPLIRSFFSYTIAPTVQILSPPLSDRGRTFVTPSVRIRWTGYDEDGILHNHKPVKYKYILLTQNTPIPYRTAFNYPDSVRLYYAPRHWAGWDSTSSDTTEVQFTNLVPQQDYMFVVIAIDEAGAYSPIFNQNTNMLNMRATYAAAGGPQITIWSDIFFYTYNPPVHDPSPQYQVPVEIAAGLPITIRWTAVAGSGAEVVGTRWALDIEDIADNTPRSNERTDLKHWSQWSSASSATVGPFESTDVHFFYVEALDNNGLRSLATVRLFSVGVTLEKPLLVVTDTRLVLDEIPVGGNCVGPPRGRWPYSAELDTFLFARGGVPWRCYPTGTITSPGLFAGYAFDTTGTRTGKSVVRVPLAKLGHYQHLIWITDTEGGLQDGQGTSLNSSMGALRYMTKVGQANSLAAYITLGGNAWVVGGGAAYASTINYNKPANDVTNPAPGTTFSDLQFELVPGRFMFDLPHWQSEIKVSFSPLQITRYRGRFDAPGRTPPAMYATLPAQMRPKSAALGDVFPPNRAVNPGDFYVPYFAVEYLSRSNRVTEDVDPDLLHVDEQSTLDTLYRAAGPSLMPASFNAHNVCMTYYHGPGNTPVLFTGFNLWSFARVDCKALVDAVLQRIWGLPYSPPAPTAPASASRASASPEASLASGAGPPGGGAASRTR